METKEKLKQVIEELESYKGRHTELISVMSLQIIV